MFINVKQSPNVQTSTLRMNFFFLWAITVHLSGFRGGLASVMMSTQQDWSEAQCNCAAQWLLLLLSKLQNAASTQQL